MTPLRTKILLFFLIVFFGGAQYSYAQPQDSEVKLAAHYYDKGEFDKAEEYYEKLQRKYPTFTYIERYFYCLYYQQKYDECEKYMEKQIKRDPINIQYKFMLASIYEETERPEEAIAIYDQMIKEMAPIQSRIDALGKAFKLKGMYGYSLKTYQEGKKLLKRGYQFQLELAELYSLLDKPYEMIQEYLNLLEYSPVYLNTVQTYLSRVIDFEEDHAMVEMLKEELLIRVQKNPDKEYYNEMLIWYYLHKKEFKGAVIQAKALDKRQDKQGQRVYQIGLVCRSNEAYDEAQSAFQYIIDLGLESPYYPLAIEMGLAIKFEVITQKGIYSETELSLIAGEFESALDKLGINRQTIRILIQLAEIYAFYLNQPEKAEELVKKGLEIPLAPKEKAELKILLGDIYIVTGNIWDASILYMQVEKDFSEDIIGHEAKFKNAKVFYYDGEFEYAKAQLDVLKASTSKLIANDAMQLSLLLQDNLGIDTTRAPVQMFANADLLIQQNRFDEALLLLDSISIKYPFHSLTDEVLFKKGEIYEHLQNWDKAIEYYDVVVQSYSFDILGDDAAFRIAKIYENRLYNKEKAAEYYKKILFEFKGSLYTSESIKRYNELKEFL